MRRRPPRDTRTVTLFPYTTRVRSPGRRVRADGAPQRARAPLLQPAAGPGGEPGAGVDGQGRRAHRRLRSEEHTSELQSLMRTSYAVFCLKKKMIALHIISAVHTRDKKHNDIYYATYKQNSLL